MLRGQATLSRLVGKRRRLDPTSSVDASAIPEGGTNFTSSEANFGNGHVHCKRENEVFSLSIVKSAGKNPCPSSSCPLNWVKCPVCEKDIQADDRSINIHIDLCLLEKSSQKIVQFNDSASVCSVQVPLEVKRLSLKNAKQNHLKASTCKAEECLVLDPSRLTPDILAGENNLCVLKAADLNEIKGGCQFETKSVVVSVSCVKHDILEINQSRHDHENTLMHHICDCPCHVKWDGQGTQKKGNFPDDQYQDSEHPNREVLSLETVIVGRKFNRHVKIKKDMEIKALREPENPKDANAIKIVGPDNQGNLTVGHLPRNLASLLSSLLDTGLLKIKGIILKAPEKASEPVPIKLFCEKTFGVKKEDPDLFKESWQRILEAGKMDNQKQESFNHHQNNYAHNFSYLLKVVLERESHLFSETELALLSSFFSLTENAQCLFVRLSQRKGPWFRVSQISYVEISDVKQATNELLASGFFSSGDGFEEDACFEKVLRERMHVLPVPELKQILSVIHMKNKIQDSLKRDELLDRIVSAAKEKYENSANESGSKEMAITPLILKTIGFCVRLSDTASFLLWRVQRLFFLNGEQDASAFLLVNIGATKYPSYICNQTRKVFETRDSLLAYEQALELAQAMDIAVESNDLKSMEHCFSRAYIQLSSFIEASATGVKDCGSSKDVFLDRFTAAWVYATVVSLGVSVLERERRYAEAVKLLRELLSQPCCPGKQGYWTVRLSMDLEHLGYKEESLEVAEAGLNDPRIRHGDRVALQKRVLRLSKPPRRWKKPSFAKALAQSCKEVIITGRPLNCQAGVKSRFYGYDDSRCSVEELALQYYAGDSGGGWEGVHSESGIWMTLFGLLMWDVLFADIPNVFWHSFQTAPVDLTTDAFYPGREVMIEQQLGKIQHGEAPQLLARTWSKWFGTSCKGLNWERHSLEELLVMVSCVGGCGLASICRLLAEDYAGLAAGMPDLFLWRVMPSSSSKHCGHCCGSAYPSSVGEAKLVEVKGPRDRLSEQQQAWINILMEAGINVEVCKVHEQPKSEG